MRVGSALLISGDATNAGVASAVMAVWQPVMVLRVMIGQVAPL
jgi:hypothetical protein